MLVGSVTNLNEVDQIGPLVDLVEMRLDFFDLLKKPQYPCIFTLRKKEQGGSLEIKETDRLRRIEKMLEMEPEFLDIEADTESSFIEKIAKKFPKVKLIGSYHNFDETPLDLDELLKKMRNPHFAIYKIAVKANSTSDMLRLMLFAKHSKEPLSVMSMGEFGKPSRVLAKIMGSLLDYTGLTEDAGLQRYGIQELLNTFHYSKLNKNTLIYALIGDPVEKSPGHLFHNARFKQNGVYVKMVVRPNEIAEVFSLIRKLSFGGLSVTIPLKEKIKEEMDEIKPVAEVIGAINTVTFKKGKAIGTNTDGLGALNALEKHLKVVGKQIAILGAGGAARAIVYESLQRGAKVSIFNRTFERAQKLAKEFGCEGLDFSELAHCPYDILINTIPEEVLIDVRSKTAVMDIALFPKETSLLKEAKKRGCICIYGEEMFVEQALLQQKEWSQ